MHKHTKESPIVQRRQTILFLCDHFLSDPMLKKQVKNKNPVTGRVADQLKEALLTSPSDVNLVCCTDALPLPPSPTKKC